VCAVLARSEALPCALCAHEMEAAGETEQMGGGGFSVLRCLFDVIIIGCLMCVFFYVQTVYKGQLL